MDEILLWIVIVMNTLYIEAFMEILDAVYVQ